MLQTHWKPQSSNLPCGISLPAKQSDTPYATTGQLCLHTQAFLEPFLDFTSNIRLTQLEKLGEEFQHPVAELRRQIFIGSRHHYLDKLTTRKKGAQNQ